MHRMTTYLIAISMLLCGSNALADYTLGSHGGGGLVPNSDLPDAYADVIEMGAIHTVNHVSNRRRLTTVFPNEQSPFYGIQINFVNVGRGNLTFLIRDLVRIDRLPIVFGRVYDSTLSDSDFGPGWKLSVSEFISREGSILRYTDASNSLYELHTDGTTVWSSHPRLTGIKSGWVSNNIVELSVNGLTKRFRNIGGLFKLVQVTDGNRNALLLHYGRDGLVQRIASTHERFVEMSRDGQGRIVAATDDAGRSVAYEYDADGNLAIHYDLSGAPWRMAYARPGQLATVVDPREESVVQARFGDSGRAEHVAVQYDAMTFEYAHQTTTVNTTLQRSATFWQHASGLTHAAQDFEGAVTELAIDSDLQPVSLTLNGTVFAELSYNSAGQLQTLTRPNQHGAATDTLYYDSEGRITGIHRGNELIAAYEYDDSGNVISAQDGKGTRRYVFNDEGQIHSLILGDGTSIGLQTNDHGLITRIVESDQTLRIGYDTKDRVEGLTFVKDRYRYSTEFSYDDLGLRLTARYLKNGSELGTASFEYDPVGNMKEFSTASQAVNVAEVYRIGRKNELQEVSNSHGTISFEYDVAGRLSRMVAGEREGRFRHDQLGRLSGLTIDREDVLSSMYGPMDLDVAAEADDVTPFTNAASATVSSVFGTLDAIVYTRPRGSLFGPVRFNEAMARFVVTELPAADSIMLASLLRRKVPFADEAEVNPWQRVINPAVMGFDKPSNSLFLPPEFFSVNCLWCAAHVSGVTLRGNGQANNVTVNIGQTVTFQSDLANYPASYCLFYFEPVLYHMPYYHYLNYGDGGGTVLSGPQNPPTEEPVYANHSYSEIGWFSASTTIVCEDSCGYGVFDSGTAWLTVEVLPVCSTSRVDSAATGAVLLWSLQEPWERGVTLVCDGLDVIIFGPYRDSFGQFYGPPATNDPCKVTIYVGAEHLAAGAHSHPYFTTAAQYHAGLGCFGDQAPITPQELANYNVQLQQFGDGDHDFVSQVGKPFYMRVPLGNQVKRLNTNHSTTVVYP